MLAISDCRDPTEVTPREIKTCSSFLSPPTDARRERASLKHQVKYSNLTTSAENCEVPSVGLLFTFHSLKGWVVRGRSWESEVVTSRERGPRR
jgi:hypothetical protein